MKEIQDYYIRGNFITREKLNYSLINKYLIRYVKYLIKASVASSLIFLNKLFNKSSKEYKYKVSLCGIFKNEAKFLEEWIEFNIVVGIDHFYLYDNNSTDNYMPILKPYIDKGIVELINWPFEHTQMEAYEHCYQKNRNNTNWLTFLDVDEFVCPRTTDNIKTWLLNFSNYPGVAIYWKQFGSNGKLIHDYNELVIEQYTQCWPLLGAYTKMFCNMNFPIVEFKEPHVYFSRIFGIKIPPVNQYKRTMCMGIHRTSFFGESTIQINHYWGKAYDCFVENKINRSDVYHKNDQEMAELRKGLLKSYETMCTARDYTIQRFLLQIKSINEPVNV